MLRTNPKTGVKEKVPRVKPSKPPCNRCPKIPEGKEPKPANAVELNIRNILAFMFHERCRATRSWPDDWVVAEKARIIESVREAASSKAEAVVLRLLEIGRYGREA